MADERAKRRLAAVADVVGYSRLMEADETGTLAALRERRKTVLEPIVRDHEGRIVKVMGDGVLVEFASAVNAVKAALELQEKMAEANTFRHSAEWYGCDWLFQSSRPVYRARPHVVSEI